MGVCDFAIVNLDPFLICFDYENTFFSVCVIKLHNMHNIGDFARNQIKKMKSFVYVLFVLEAVCDTSICRGAANCLLHSHKSWLLSPGDILVRYLRSNLFSLANVII